MVAWVTRPERPKGAKDAVKRPEGPPADFLFLILVGVVVVKV